jgi:hypothetical protein
LGLEKMFVGFSIGEIAWVLCNFYVLVHC